MPTTLFDWIVRTAMLAMAGLVTLSILGAIAAMTNDPGTRFAAPGDRPVIEGRPPEPRETAAPPSSLEEGSRTVEAPAESQSVTTAATAPAAVDPAARWLEAIAYALLAIAGICALGVLMLWSAVRELRRIGRAGS